MHYYHWIVIRILAACLIKGNQPPFSRSSYYILISLAERDNIFTPRTIELRKFISAFLFEQCQWLNSVTLMRSVISIIFIFYHTSCTVGKVTSEENDHHRPKHTNKQKLQSIMRLHEFHSFLFPFLSFSISFPCHFIHNEKLNDFCCEQLSHILLFFFCAVLCCRCCYFIKSSFVFISILFSWKIIETKQLLWATSLRGWIFAATLDYYYF